MISTAKQRQLIGILRKQLKLEDDFYKELLLQNYGVESSKDLSQSQARELLQNLKSKASKMGYYQAGFGAKFQNLSGRYGMGTPPQLRKIDAMWKSVSRQKTNAAKESALNSFIERITGKKRLAFLTQNDVKKVIKAIETMQKQEDKQND